MNYNYLISGTLAIILSIAHSVWGEKTIIPDLKKANLQELTIAGFYISWYQINITLLVSGIGLILLSFSDSIEYVKTTVIFISAIMLCNFLVFLIISAAKHKAIFARTIPQTVLFIIMIVMMVLGTLR